MNNSAYRTLYRPWRLAAFFFACALLLVATGCATREDAPPRTEPVKAETPATARADSPADSAPAPPAQPSGTGEGRGKSAGEPAAAKAVKAPRQSAADRMLQSAGRLTGGPQPEPGFTLNVPDTVGDGEAFLFAFGAQGVRQVTVRWREGAVALDPQKSASPGLCQALLPVPLDEKAKSLPLAVDVVWEDGKKETFSADLAVQKRRYPVQRLKVDSKFVTPPPSEKERIARDRERMRAALSTRTAEQRWSLPMQKPVPGEITSLYGLRRVFNNVPKNPHKGLDLDAKEGDPIQAADGGTVTLADDQYYGGNTVVIDHGLGVFTIYMHMSAINVSEGQRVSRGEIIGLIGSTGRVTGPHLHLSLVVLGQSINIAPWLDM